MRIARIALAAGGLPPPLWPPLVATRGPGAASEAHAHHAMHLIVATAGELRFRAGRGRWASAAGVLTAPDVAHAIDASGVEVLLVFFDPESDAGEALRAVLDAQVRAVTEGERARIPLDEDPTALMREGGGAFTRAVVDALGGARLPPRRMHPRVRKVVRQLRALPASADTSLEALSALAGLSPGRFMHAFTASMGVPLRPYLAWLKLERATAAIAMGAPLAQAAYAGGFSDAAHMTRSFKRMFGTTPSKLAPAR
jgi:AraC-like DNA-binding protein